MKNVLEEIIKNKRKELRVFKEFMSVSAMEEKIEEKQTYDFFEKILKFQGNIGLIGEVKMKSPSHGSFIEEKDIIEADKIFQAMNITEKRVKSYEQAGVDAISIVTDEKYFGGHYSMITAARSVTKLPILQKDFVIDEIQIYFSKFLEASALLLITRILEKPQLKTFVDLCLDMRLEPVVEVYDEQDLEKALTTKARFIGVNARDLDTFEVSIERACELGKQIPEDRVFIGFSGVSSKQEVGMYKKAGAKAVLVGSALMTNKKPEVLIKDLKG